MSDHKLQPVLEIANVVREAEAAISTALIKAAGLAQALPLTAEKMNLSPTVVRCAVDRTGQLVSGISSSFRQIAEIHHVLDGLRDRLGLPAVAFGDKLPISDGRDLADMAN